MAEFTFKTETIDYLLDKVKQSGVTRLKLKCDEFEIDIEAAPAAAAVPVAPAATPAAVSAEPALSGNVMRSPIVGTFYASPSPDKAPFAEVGKQVHKGDVLFIIESMKLMNEIKSEYDGRVAQILVQPGDAVEYDQPIMVIE